LAYSITFYSRKECFFDLDYPEISVNLPTRVEPANHPGWETLLILQHSSSQSLGSLRLSTLDDLRKRSGWRYRKNNRYIVIKFAVVQIPPPSFIVVKTKGQSTWLCSPCDLLKTNAWKKHVG
jgi:hypothetical protein